MQLIVGHPVESYVELVQEYMSASYLEREKIFQQFLGDSKKNISPDKSGAQQFISEILTYVSLQNNLVDKTVLYRDIEDMQKYIMNRSSSLKYIFEYISIRAPRF